MQQQLFDVLIEALEIEGRELSLEDNFRDYPEWDSLGQLSVIAALDETFGVVIEGSEFKNLQTVGDLLRKIESLG